MLVKLTTIHEEIVNFNAPHQVSNSRGHKKYVIEEIFVNPQHIVYLKEDLQYVELHVKGNLPEGFPKGQKFTRVGFNRGNMGEEVTAIGELAGLAKKINGE